MSADAQTHLEAVRLSYSYKRMAAPALRDATFSIGRGEALAIVGQSGCGKSTLLHILSGLTLPTSGELRIDGIHVAGPSPRWIVMFQQPHLYPWMTVAQNIGLGLKFAGRSAEIPGRVGELLRLVDLEEYGGRNVQDLSGGQAQRVALARSLALRPELLLLDEPFSALDQVTRHALRRDVRRIASEFGITLVIVTHDIAEAVTTADRALVMSRGCIQETVTKRSDPSDAGAADKLFQKELQAAFERTSTSLAHASQTGESRDAAA